MDGITVRASHRFTNKRGWQATTSVQITQQFAADLPPSNWEDQLAYSLQRADELARAESDRRNQIDGWTPPQENQ